MPIYTIQDFIKDMNTLSDVKKRIEEMEKNIHCDPDELDYRIGQKQELEQRLKAYLPKLFE